MKNTSLDEEEKKEDEFEEKTKGKPLPKKLGKAKKDDANEEVG